MTTATMVQMKREAILEAAAKRGAENVRIFGSIVRGEDQPNSDVDFLVDLLPGRTLMDLGALGLDLEALLGRKVDVLTSKGLHWYIRDRVLQEARPI